MNALFAMTFAAEYQYTDKNAPNYTAPPPVPSQYQFVDASKPNYISLPATPTPYQYTEPAKPYFKPLPAEVYQAKDQHAPLYKKKDDLKDWNNHYSKEWKNYQAPVTVKQDTNPGYQAQTDGYSASSSVVTGIVSIVGAMVLQ